MSSATMPASGASARRTRSARALDPIGHHRALEHLDPAAGADDLRAHLDRADRRRAQQLVGDAGQREPIRRGQLLERAHQEGGGGTPVLSSGIPGAAGRLGCDETAIGAFEHWLGGHGGES